MWIFNWPQRPKLRRLEYLVTRPPSTPTRRPCCCRRPHGMGPTCSAGSSSRPLRRPGNSVWDAFVFYYNNAATILAERIDCLASKQRYGPTDLRWIFKEIEGMTSCWNGLKQIWIIFGLWEDYLRRYTFFGQNSFLWPNFCLILAKRKMFLVKILFFRLKGVPSSKVPKYLGLVHGHQFRPKGKSINSTYLTYSVCFDCFGLLLNFD